MKICANTNKCSHKREPQPVSAFYKNKYYEDGLAPQCKDCQKEYFSYGKNLPKKYPGLTANIVKNLFEGKAICKICGRSGKWGKGKYDLCIDHCHITNVFRGILCGHHNKILGMLNEDPVEIQQLKAYAEFCVNIKNQKL